MDNSFSTLQSKYDVFKPVVPILSTTPYITAKIGMKEGLKGSEKFSIMQKVEDPETHKTSWQKVGETTVNSSLVWDNRYIVGEEQPEKIVLGKDGLPIKMTTFYPNNAAKEGMFLKQKK
jgi:hypothetical protein